MKRFFLFLISIIVCALPQNTQAQNAETETTELQEEVSLLPSKDGEKEKFSVYIEIKKAYISGIGILVCKKEEIVGSIFNEFGVSAIDFSYHSVKDKVKLHHVFPPLNKWYIKRVLRKNLKSLIHNMQRGESEYVDSRREITYKLKPLK